jgi:hypothetical protein
MYKFIPLFSSRLVAPLASGATSMQLTPVDAAFLASQLTGGAWTYVAFADGPHREVVKITGVSGSFASIVRAQDGTTARAWAINDCFTSVLGPSAIFDLVTQGGVDTSLSITGTGVASVTQPTPRNYIVNVPPVNIQACEDSPVEVLGTFPNYTICFDRSALNLGCGLTSPPMLPMPDVGELILGTGIVNVVYNDIDGTYVINADPVNITAGANISVTGTYPNFEISYTGPIGGSGTVTEVSAGTGIVVTGLPTVSPIVSLTNTGVVSGNYAGFIVDAQGRITAIPVPPGPHSGPIFDYSLHLSLETANSLSLTRVGHAVTLRAHAASTATDGWGVVRLAPPTATESRDAGDSLRAVSPAGLDAVLSGFTAGSANGLLGASSGEAAAAYTVTASSTVVNLNAGEAIFAIASAIATHSTTPLTSVAEFGIGIFVDSSLVSGTRIVQSNIHTVMAKITGAGPKVLELRHSTLGSGFSLTTSQLGYIIVKA